MANATRIVPATSRESAEMQQMMRFLTEANNYAERLKKWMDAERSGDVPAGNTEIGTQMGAADAGSTIYTATSNIVTALDGLEDEIATITW